MASPRTVRAPRGSGATAARRLAKRAFRARERRFLAEGPQVVREALGAGVVTELFATGEATRRYPELLTADPAIRASEVAESVLADLTQTVTPQGIVAVCGFVDVGLPELLVPAPSLVAVMAHVRDPGNAGTVLRCADAAGADGVVLSSASVDVYNPKAVRASAGSLFHLPVVLDAELPATLAAIRAAGLTVLAADGGVSDAIDLDDAVDRGLLARPTAWLFGNEAWGLPAEVRSLADAVVAVPIHGRAESLNLATAAAVCLYASASAQRRAATSGVAAGSVAAGRASDGVASSRHADAGDAI